MSDARARTIRAVCAGTGTEGQGNAGPSLPTQFDWYKARVPYALVGGYAVALHGAVRGTIDIDLVIGLSEKSYVGAEIAFKRIGLLPRLPVSAQDVFAFRQEYIKKRNLIAWSFYNPQNLIEVVDIIITENLDTMKVVER